MATDEPTNDPTTPDPIDPQHAGPPRAQQPAAADAGRAASSPPPAPAAKPRRRRRWPFVVGGVVGLLLLLVLFAPALVSTGPVRSLVLSQVNKNLKGRVDIADWSISWTGGIRVTGLKVFDVESRQVAEVGAVTTQLSLLDAMKGRLALGETVVDRASFDFTQYPDGTTTVDRVVKPRDPTPEEPASDLPFVSGRVVLRNAHGTFTRNTGARETSHVVQFPAVAGEVNIPDLHAAPIEDKLEVQAAVDGGPVGTLSVAGKASVVANRRVNVDAANVNQTVTLAGFDIKSAEAFLPPQVVRDLAGVWAGTVNLVVTDGKAVTVTTDLLGTGVAFATRQFATGEVYRSNKVRISGPAIAISLPQGPTKFDAAHVRIGNGTTDALAVTADQFDLKLSADAPVATLLAAAKNERSAAGGTVTQLLRADGAALAKVIPQTMGLKPDVKVEAGRVEQSFALVTTPAGKSQVTSSVKILDVRGSAEFADDKGVKSRRAITIEPITLDLSAGLFGGGWTVPDLRDATVTLRSGFATADVKAPTLASLDGGIKFDLANVQQQLGQFLSLDKYQLKGSGEVLAKAAGDPNNLAAPAKFDIAATLRNLHLAGLTADGAAIDEPLIKFAVSGTAAQTENTSTPGSSGMAVPTGRITWKLSDTSVSAQVGEDVAPTINLAIAAPEVTTTGVYGLGGVTYATLVPRFTIIRGTIALDRVRAKYGAFLPQFPPDVELTGTAQLSGGGSYTAGGADANAVLGAVAFDGRLAVTDVNLTRTVTIAGAGPLAALRHSMEVLKVYAATVDVAATYAPDAAGGAKVAVSKLAVADNQNLLSVAKAGTGNLVVVLPADKAGQMTAAGAVTLGLDLGRVNTILKQLSATGQQVVATAGGQSNDLTLKSGRLAGTATFAQSADGSLRAEVDADLSALTVASSAPNAASVLANETMKVVLKLSAGGNFSTATVERLALTGNLANVEATAKVRLKTGPGPDATAVPMLAMVQEAKLTATTDDLGKVQAILNALPQSPKATAAAAAARPALMHGQTGVPIQLAQVGGNPLPRGATPATQPAAVPPAELAGGSATITVTATGDGTQLVIVPNVQAKGVVLAVGRATYPVGDITLNSRAAIVSAPPQPQAPAAAVAPGTQPAAGPSLIEQIAELRVTELSAAGVGSTVTLKQPIVVKGLADLPALFAPATKPADPATASLTGAIAAAGQLDPLMKLQAFLGGEQPTSAYGGTYTLDETIATEAGRVRLTGGGLISDFVSRDAQGKPQFQEKAVRLANNLALDTAGTGAVDLQQFRLAFESSGALVVDVVGRVADLKASRGFQGVKATVTTNLAPLWKIAHPMLIEPGTPPEKDPYKDYLFEGKSTREFTLEGNFPAIDAAGNPVPFGQAIKSVAMNGSFGFDRAAAEGLDVRSSVPGQQAEVWLDLRGGVLRTADLRRAAGQQVAAPWSCNGGTMTVNGFAVDLTGAFPTLAAPEPRVVLQNVQLTPALSDFLGGMLNNPTLVQPGDTKGVINLTVLECRDVPLGKEAKLPANNRGHAVVEYAFGGIQLGTQSWGPVASFLKVDVASLQGSIPKGRAVYARGVIGHDMTLALGERQDRTIHLYGNTRLADGTMVPMTMLFSPALLQQVVGGDIAKYLPKGLPLSLTGHFRAPRYNLQVAFQEAVKQNYFSGKPEDLGNIIDLFNRKKDDKRSPANDGAGGPTAAGTQPARPGTPQAELKDPVGGLLGGLLDRAAQEREKKEREKKEKERRDREKRER